MAKARLIIRNGYVIETEGTPSARPGADVLIEDGRIAAVGAGLEVADAEVIDATDRIVLPGFVDTHRHVWQSALRSIAPDVDLGGYLGLILGQLAPRFRPQDVYAATLAGALELLDSGITTVMDYSQVVHTPDHADAAVDALEAAGLRAVFGYGFPVTGGGDAADVRRVRAERLADDTTLVTMALAPVGPAFAPIEQVSADWQLATELDLPITFHVSRGPAAAQPVSVLRDHGLLRPNTLFVHGNSLDDGELKLIADSGGTASVAPAGEAQMGSGAPVAGRLRSAGVVTGLGVDSVVSIPGDMFSLMRATLLAGQIADDPRFTVQDVLRMATIDGAVALGLADRIGSLSPGKQADVVLLRLDDLNMLTGERDPVAAVVTAAQPGNVDTVLVAGQVVKSAGRLLGHDVATVAGSLRETAAAVTSA
jgi:5-methylthioadenosine/S-adenosylhomocysteine deaminase